MLKKILFVDDEPDVTSSISKVLERYGFEVDTFNDPLEALSKFIPNYYNLLLIDIRMPKMNGFELYREIRKKDDKCSVCFLTAFEMYQQEFVKAFPELDPGRFIKKPTRINDLVARINGMLDIKITLS